MLATAWLMEPTLSAVEVGSLSCRGAAVLGSWFAPLQSVSGLMAWSSTPKNERSAGVKSGFLGSHGNEGDNSK